MFKGLITKKINVSGGFEIQLDPFKLIHGEPFHGPKLVEGQGQCSV